MSTNSRLRRAAAHLQRLAGIEPGPEADLPGFIETAPGRFTPADRFPPDSQQALAAMMACHLALQEMDPCAYDAVLTHLAAVRAEGATA